MKLFIHTDGGARGNPGPGAIGIVIANEKKETIKEIGKFIGRSTNNEAEYRAVVEALKACGKRKNLDIAFFIDSLLVVNQLNGKFRVKEPRMKKYFNEIKLLEKNFKSVKYTHIERFKNYVADKIVNEVLDNAR
jgi:ribonuclease HI